MDLVTGASGFLGNVLVRELKKEGRDIRALLRNTSSRRPLKDLDIEIFNGDILDAGSLYRAFKNIDTVYHAAGFVTILGGQKELIHRINVQGTRNVIDACIRMGVRKLVFTSSVTAIKEPPDGAKIDETLSFCADNKRSFYDISKAVSSIEVLTSLKNGLDAVIVCPTGIIGPYDFNITPMTQFFIDYLNKKLRVKISGAYDFVDVRDVAVGHILAGKKGKKGQTYILSGQKLTMDELFRLLEIETGIKAPRYDVPVRVARFASEFIPLIYRFKKSSPCFTKYSIDTLQKKCDFSYQKAYEELGYNPRPIKESISDAIRWLRENMP